MRLLALAFGGLALAVCAAAQDRTARVQGYGYFGILGDNGTPVGKLLNPGGGVDVFAYRGLAASIDAGYVGYYNEFRYSGIGVISPGVSYHFFKSKKIVPFVNAGYSVAFRNDHFSMANYGGGFTYWFSKRVGLRVQGRDYRDMEGYRLGGVQVGISFR